MFNSWPGNYSDGYTDGHVLGKATGYRVAKAEMQAKLESAMQILADSGSGHANEEAIIILEGIRNG